MVKDIRSKEIDNILYRTKCILLDVEMDFVIGAKWNPKEKDSLTFSVEWADIFSSVKQLIPIFESGNITNLQKKKFESLRQRFIVDNKKIKELGLDNPFVS
jgi:hypothetical protein